ncbi:uncharacterized protein LOC135705198 [Ochlerotatus camptorhynchus]|uniref:uncharacterized protein LOC135705198 n=1 Tax=Ochlerotatus camptorhynchus TaxID=644619 RepID=UPI0031D3B342
MNNLLSIGIIILIHVTASFAKLYPCDRKQTLSSCYIENITIGSNENHGSVRFEEVRRLIIEFGTIPTFSQDLFANLAEAESLSLKGGHIVSVDFNSDTLSSLRIDKTGLQNLSIAPVPNYNLDTLLINRNLLTALPKTIRYLFALSILDLSQNRIEYVNLNWFQQMDNLLILDLSWNHIARMDATSDLRLAKLKNLFVNFNHLSQIPWFPIGFPTLGRIRLADNYWNCAWVASMRPQIWDRHIQLFDSDGACSEKSEGGLCCYDQIPVELPARYELIEIEFQQQPNGLAFEKISERPQMLMAEPETEKSEGTCAEREEKVRTLQKEKLALMKEKVEIEQQFAKKATSLQEILRTVREDLEASEKELSRYRYQERLDLIRKTSGLKTEKRSSPVVGVR